MWRSAVGAALILVVIGRPEGRPLRLEAESRPLRLDAAQAAAPSGATTNSIPRIKDGKPDLSGIWQVMNAAAFDIQAHQSRKGVPAGTGVVVGDEIPYQPAALARTRENFDKR